MEDYNKQLINPLHEMIETILTDIDYEEFKKWRTEFLSEMEQIAAVEDRSNSEKTLCYSNK